MPTSDTSTQFPRDIVSSALAPPCAKREPRNMSDIRQYEIDRLRSSWKPDSSGPASSRKPLQKDKSKVSNSLQPRKARIDSFVRAWLPDTLNRRKCGHALATARTPSSDKATVKETSMCTREGSIAVMSRNIALDTLLEKADGNAARDIDLDDFNTCCGLETRAESSVTRPARVLEFRRDDLRSASRPCSHRPSRPFIFALPSTIVLRSETPNLTGSSATPRIASVNSV
jgi:hypothetical protein